MTDVNVRATSTGLLRPSSGATSITFTLPSGLTVGDPLKLFVTSANATTDGVVTAPTGWSFDIAQTTMGTGSFYVLKRTGGWQTADGTSLIVTLSGVTTSLAVAYAAVGLDQTKQSDWDTDGTVTVKGSSTTTTTASAAGTSAQDVFVVFFGKMTGNNGSPTVAPNATLVVQNQSTSASDPNIWVGSYTGVTPATQTITYAASTANGAGVQMPAVAVSSGSSSAVGVVSTSTLGITGSVTQSSAVGMSSVSTLGVSAASISAVALASTSTLGVTGTLTQSHAVGITSASTLGVSAVAPSLTRVMLGIPDTTAIRATTLTVGASTVRLAVSTSSSMTSPSFSTSTSPDGQGYCTNLTVTGLTAGTGYWYKIELNGALVGSAVGVATLPTTPVSFSLAFGSCIATLGTFGASVNPDVFTAINNRPSISGRTGPEEFWFLGDNGYPNNSSSPGGDYIPDNATTIRSNLENGFQPSKLSALMAATPTGYTWSDNDSGGGNCDAGSGAWLALTNGTAGGVVRQITSYPTLPDAAALYHSHMRGRVLIITIDDRTYSSGGTVTDNSSKTKLGATQRTWLQGVLAGAKAAGAAQILIMAEDMWVDTGGTSSAGNAGLPTQNDGWGAYGTERTTIAGYITGCGVPVLWCCGDTHTIETDNGTHNTHGSFPVFCAAPFYQTATANVTGLTFSNGTYPASDQQASFYGWLDVTDNGVTISVTATAYDSTSSAGVYTSDVVRGTPLSIVTVTPSATMLSTSTLAVTGTVTQSAAVGMASTSTISVTAAITTPGVVPIRSTSVIGVVPSGFTTAAVAINSTSTVTVTGTLQQAGVVGLVSSSTLAVAGVVSRTAAVAMSSVSAVGVTGSSTPVGVVGISSISALTVAGTQTVFSTVDMRSVSTISVRTASQDFRDVTVTVGVGPPRWQVSNGVL